MPKKKKRGKKKGGAGMSAERAAAETLLAKALAYDHNHPENYTSEDLNELMDDVPIATSEIAKEIKCKKAEMELYDTAEHKLVAAVQAIQLLEIYGGLVTTAGHITLDQCKKYKQKAEDSMRREQEKDRQLKEMESKVKELYKKFKERKREQDGAVPPPPPST